MLTHWRIPLVKDFQISFNFRLLIENLSLLYVLWFGLLLFLSGLCFVLLGRIFHWMEFCERSGEVKRSFRIIILRQCFACEPFKASCFNLKCTKVSVNSRIIVMNYYFINIVNSLFQHKWINMLSTYLVVSRLKEKSIYFSIILTFFAPSLVRIVMERFFGEVTRDKNCVQFCHSTFVFKVL